MNWKEKKILVLGLGRYTKGSGSSAVRYFSRHGAYVTVNDKKTSVELRESVRVLCNLKNVTFVLGGHPLHLVSNADFVFQNPGVPDSHPLIVACRRKKIPIINDWSVFFSHPRARCIAVTGTRGKSTTTMMLYAMVKRKFRTAILAGNMGISPLTFLDGYKGELVVAELSSWLLRGFRATTSGPYIATITNIMRDHQNQYRRMADYIADKELIFSGQDGHDVTVLNYDDAIVRDMKKRSQGTVWWFGKKIPPGSNGVFLKDETIWIQQGAKKSQLMGISDMKIPGMHNVYNAMAAATTARAAGVATEDIRFALLHFRGVPNRLEKIAMIHGTAVYNDTTATTPDATIAALEALSPMKKPITLIAGGADKKLEYRGWGTIVSKCAHYILLIPGSATEKMKKELRRNHSQFQEVATLRKAWVIALKGADKGIVLFSPGAASFNMFKNEFDRGDQFRALVSKKR